MADKKFKGNVKVGNNIDVANELGLTAETNSRALELDGSGKVKSSAVTSTELGHVSGVTSAIQTQLGNKISTSEKGAANGVATLDGGSKIPAAQLPSTVMEYKGAWNASTNSPALADGAGDAGDVYRASVAGSQDLGSGSQTWGIGDLIIYSGTIWEKAPASDAVSSVFGRTGAVTAATSDYDAVQIDYDNSGSGLSATDVKGALDELDSDVGSADVKDLKVSLNDTTAGFLEDKITSADSSISITTLNDAGDEDLDITVNEANVDHDSLSGFVANEHIDHSSVNVNTNADSGLSGGGDLTASRTLVVDINGTTAETTADDADTVLIYDDTAGALRKMTRANFVGAPGSSSGDISETSFAGANNQAAAANVTGLAFANGTVRSFRSQVSVVVDATADLYEVHTLHGIQKGASWDMSVESTGDDSSVVFTITSAGQVQYTSANYAGFVSLSMKFRAETTSV